MVRATKDRSLPCQAVAAEFTEQVAHRPDEAGRLTVGQVVRLERLLQLSGRKNIRIGGPARKKGFGAQMKDSVVGSRKIIYTGRYGWFLRLVPWVTVGMILILLPSIPQIWRQDWILGLGVCLAYLISGAALLETHMRKTIFTDSGIYQRTMFGAGRLILYAQVCELVIRRGESLIIKSQQGKSLKIHAKEGGPEDIVQTIEPFLSPETRVTTF